MSRPCGSCPYLRSTPVGLWDQAEFDNLRKQDADPMAGKTFGCHLRDGSLCRGWLADQKRRGVPSIRLRLALCFDERAGETFSAVDEKDPDLYASIEEMCEANQGAEFPAHDRAAQKLLRRVQA